ncbi:hypothetical protein Tco_0059980 [Tanacetum coccineum]
MNDHLKAQQVMNDSMSKLCETFQTWLQQQQEQVVNLDTYTPKPSQCRKIPICYDDDDDDEESSIPLRDIIIFELPPCIAIIPILLTKEPIDSLIMEDKHLDTIPKPESDKLIKSSVENLFHTPSECDGISESECDFPVCDDSSPKKDEVLDDIISIPLGNGILYNRLNSVSIIVSSASVIVSTGRSTNEVSTASGDFGVSTTGGINQVPSTPSAHDIAYSFLAQPTTSPQLELKQIYNKALPFRSCFKVGEDDDHDEISANIPPTSTTINHNKTLTLSLPISWSQVSLIMTTKPGVDSLSFDDLYNNLRVFEPDVKGNTRSSSSAQNATFAQNSDVEHLVQKECEEVYAKLKKLYDEQREQLGDASIEIQAYTQALKN